MKEDFDGPRQGNQEGTASHPSGGAGDGAAGGAGEGSRVARINADLDRVQHAALTGDESDPFFPNVYGMAQHADRLLEERTSLRRALHGLLGAVEHGCDHGLTPHVEEAWVALKEDE